MKVLKFGGTSVGSPERMKSLPNIIPSSGRRVVVLSAVSGTTNSLVEISQAYLNNDKAKAAALTDELYDNYKRFVRELLSSEEGYQNGIDLIDYHFNLIHSFANELFTPIEEKVILAQGELISTTLYHFYLTEIGIRSKLLLALDFMKIDEDNEPVMDFISEHLQAVMSQYPDENLFITQGFICRNAFGEIDNLRRGGSDYTASLIDLDRRPSGYVMSRK